MSETVLMLVVPEAEQLVKPFRDAYDPSATLGAPAHITVLYPFLQLERIDARVEDLLAEFCAEQASIDFRLLEIGRFSPDHVLYLAPDPDEPFRRLTEGIWHLFPSTPPYAGRHAEIIPHLSVARVQTSEQLRKIEADFKVAASTYLPITARATALALFDNASGRWEQRLSFPLAGR